MKVSERGRRSSSAVLIYVIVLMAMQVFLVTVAAEAFLSDEAGLAWSTAIVSVVLFAAAAGFLRYLRP
jgi:positive regulator of sigma E activity